MKWQQPEQREFPDSLFHRRGICSVDNKKTWILCTLEMPWPKAGPCVARVHRQEYTGRRKGSLKECCSRIKLSYRWHLHSLPDFTATRYPIIKTWKLLKLLEYQYLDFPAILKTFLCLNLQNMALGFWKLFSPPFCHPLVKVFSCIQSELLFLVSTLSSQSNFSKILNVNDSHGLT